MIFVNYARLSWTIGWRFVIMKRDTLYNRLKKALEEAIKEVKSEKKLKVTRIKRSK
jgi:hypothetical protein